MGINVEFFGRNKPGPGVKPVRVQKFPFGTKPDVNWWTGKHPKIGPDEPAGAGITDHELTGQYHSDVNAADPVAGDTLVFDGEKWIRSAKVPCEWEQAVVGTNFTVLSAPVTWANITLWDSSGGGEWVSTLSVTIPFDNGELTPPRTIADGDVRWLYVEIKLASGILPVTMLGANNYFPIDDVPASIVRWRLSKWRFTVSGGVKTATRLYNAWEKGAIHLAAEVGPP